MDGIYSLWLNLRSERPFPVDVSLIYRATHILGVEQPSFLCLNSLCYTSLKSIAERNSDHSFLVLIACVVYFVFSLVERH
jgi:hypothetical protein